MCGRKKPDEDTERKRVLAVAMSSSSGIVKHVSSLAEIASCAASKEAKGVVWDRGEHAHAAAMSNWLAENRGSKMFYTAVRGMSYAQERLVINAERMASASTADLEQLRERGCLPWFTHFRYANDPLHPYVSTICL